MIPILDIIYESESFFIEILFFLKIKIIEYKINTHTHTHTYKQTWQEVHKYQIMLCMKNTKKKIG